MDSKKYSHQEVESIIKRLKESDIKELDSLFSNGGVPLFEEIKGETAGGFLAWNPKNYSLLQFFVKTLFDSPFGRWTGKEFSAPFGEGKTGKGKGVNLFKNRLLPNRFKFDVYIKNAYGDQKSCLTLDYRSHFSLMSGLVDDVRKIEDGVFLGQMYYKFLWKKEPQFLGYFVLCSLK